MYVASFAVGILAAPYFGLDAQAPTEVPVELFLFGIGTTVVLTFLFTLWYFRPKNIKASLENGIMLGLFIIGVSFALDMAVILPAMMSSNVPTDLLEYYGHPLFWVTVVSIPITSGVTATYLLKNVNEKEKTSQQKTKKQKKSSRKTRGKKK